MNIQSHLLIAMAMEKHIKDKYGLSLRSDMFYYGNIRPDMTPRGERKLPHTFKDSMVIFMRICKQLKERSCFERPPLYLFSYKLGILLHYTADFFTYAHHNPVLFRQTAAHFKYENALLDTLWHTQRQDPILPDPRGKRLDVFLTEALIQYDQGAGEPMWDADYIYYVSMVICDRMIERTYLEKSCRQSYWHKYVQKTRKLPRGFIQ
jgi:hypothetical protein